MYEVEEKVNRGEVPPISGSCFWVWVRVCIRSRAILRLFFFAHIMRFFLNVLDGGALAQGDWPILCANGLPDVVNCVLCSKRVLGALADLKTTFGVEQDRKYVKLDTLLAPPKIRVMCFGWDSYLYRQWRTKQKPKNRSAKKPSKSIL